MLSTEADGNIRLLQWDMPDESRMRESRSYGLTRRGRLEDLSFTLACLEAQERKYNNRTSEENVTA
jgi:hypothetical protein